VPADESFYCEAIYRMGLDENAGTRAAASTDVSTLSRADLDVAVEAGLAKEVK